MTRGGRRDEQGAAVVVALGLVALLVVVTAICVGTVAIILAHRRAQVAADLASLAGAGALQRGGGACVAAASIARSHHAAVLDCVVEGRTVLVVTRVELTGVSGHTGVSARARAGPVSP